ncbi:MAG: hypothetical protein ONB46_17190 [candidate division KSB1 bacterium]|nr:hypothetical protein [candidate division KSB1 bacterium]MDZ7367429.1 hypothetical protein [candidate division KSB1 bacterium]MDZ7405466.1 hypothetical protein [candidate division KSB1 bacterium]
MTEKQLRKLVVETIQSFLLAEIIELREGMRELRQCSRESLNEIREMRAEFRRNMEDLSRQIQRLAKMLEDKLSDEDLDNLFSDSHQPWMGNNWKASAGNGGPANFDGELSQTEMQAQMRQMEYRLGIIEKALQRN